MVNKGTDLPVPERDFCVRIVDLEPCIKGVTAMDDDSFANVYINARQSLECQRRAFWHEYKHIANNDFNEDT